MQLIKINNHTFLLNHHYILKQDLTLLLEMYGFDVPRDDNFFTAASNTINGLGYDFEVLFEKFVNLPESELAEIRQLVGNRSAQMPLFRRLDSFILKNN